MHDIVQIILANVNHILLHTHFLRGSVATDLRGGGSSNSNFFRSSFLNLSEKEIMKIGLCLSKLA